MSETIAEFTAQVKELKIKTDADGCMVGRLAVEFPPTDEVIVTLKKLYQPNTNVFVTVMEE